MKVIFTVGLLWLHLSVFPQSDEWSKLNPIEQEVMEVVIQVFDGMRAGDSAAVKRHFYPETSSYTAFTTKEQKRVLKAGDINNWFAAIGKPHEQVWDERIWDYQVDIDGNLSAVWVKYAFYLDTELHHCGVDAIQLAHDGEAWKIFHIADTRQQNECQVPLHVTNGATY